MFDLDSSCKFSKLQHNYSLAFVAGFKRATDEGSLPEIAQYSPYYLPLNVFTASKGSNLYILFAVLRHTNELYVCACILLFISFFFFFI